MTRPGSKCIPIATWLLGLPGVVALLAGIALLIGDFSEHPILGEPGTAIVLLVSALALLGSSAFPLVLARLASHDAAHDNSDRRPGPGDTRNQRQDESRGIQ